MVTRLARLAARALDLVAPRRPSPRAGEQMASLTFYPTTGREAKATPIDPPITEESR